MSIKFVELFLDFLEKKLFRQHLKFDQIHYFCVYKKVKSASFQVRREHLLTISFYMTHETYC